MRHSRFIPALGSEILTPIYDPLIRWGMREHTFKRALVRAAGVLPGNRVLDLGCGTGTLTLMLKRAEAQAEVFGIDADPHILEIAKSKARAGGSRVTWHRAMAFGLPYADESFDLVVSSLMTHHLSTIEKVNAFREVLRVLRPNGRFQVLDFGPPASWFARLPSALLRHMEEAAGNFDGLVLPLLRDAGFSNARVDEHFNTILGTLWRMSAIKPA